MRADFRRQYYKSLGVAKTDVSLPVEFMINSETLGMLCALFCPFISSQLIETPPADVSVLRKTCAHALLPSDLQWQVWELVLGVVPAERDARAFVRDERQQRYEDLRAIARVLVPCDDILRWAQNETTIDIDTTSSGYRLMHAYVSQLRLSQSSHGHFGHWTSLTSNSLRFLYTLASHLSLSLSSESDCFSLFTAFLYHKCGRHSLPFLESQTEMSASLGMEAFEKCLSHSFTGILSNRTIDYFLHVVICDEKVRNWPLFVRRMVEAIGPKTLLVASPSKLLVIEDEYLLIQNALAAYEKSLSNA